MSRSRIAAVFLCSLPLLAAGCATTEPRSAYAPAPASSPRTVEQDGEYMARVEQIALRRGIGVTWVNPPIKRKAAPKD